ncbi:hypothetical protein [Hufsiella ginkgonis]|uniref:DUF4386 family protein n=1 Tax=Hufsiella ginkgonis TaxID=2695274 RepID=A0A7K1XVR8_9SPHI|nr:hypothetical protein [Hufsiella ginkgonis]MXV15071.1 hypothetical protein [Hufsiella ginkgonis]
MNKTTNFYYGTAIIAGSFLMIITMALHPAGGTFEHLLRMSRMISIAHVIAIISLPVTAFGFYGLNELLKKHTLFSQFAFITFLFAMIAALFAASANGLVLPMFINNYSDADPETIKIVKLILNYNTTFNHACDFILIAGICVAMSLWSVAIVKTGALPKWLGNFGFLLSAIACVSLFSVTAIIHLTGFRLFVAGYACWSLLAGRYLSVIGELVR